MNELTSTWNNYTNYQGAQEFMNVSRERYGAGCTIELAVGEYVAEMAPEWVENRASMEFCSIEYVRRHLIAYLESTHGDEWD
jgi:hypothetical protein